MPDFSHWQRLRDIASHLQGGESIWIFDRNGDAILDSKDFPPLAVNVADREYFKFARTGSDVFVGPALRGKVRDLVFFTVSRPVFDSGGNFNGVVQCGLMASELTDFSDLLGFDMDPVITVFRLDGDIVARRPDMEQWVGRNNFSGPLFQRELPKASSGNFISVSPIDDVPRIAAFQTIPEYGLVVVAEIEEPLAMAAWHQRAFLTISSAAACGLIIVLAIVYGMRIAARERESKLALADAMVMNSQVKAELDMVRLDHLTGLANRALFFELAEATRARCRFLGSGMAFLYIDLDGFKEINDVFGHDAGDEVLMKTADILRSILRDSDLAGRIGGDEFVVFAVAPKAVMAATAASIASRIVDGIAAIGRGAGCSVGVAILPPDCSDLSCAVKRADAAMYLAKRSGKGRHVTDASGDRCCIHREAAA